MRKGFTLIELVMVIVILGILAAVAIPAYVNLSQNARVSAAKGSAGTIRAAIAIKIASNEVNSISPAVPAALTAAMFQEGVIPTNPLSPAANTVVSAYSGAGGWVYYATQGTIESNDAARTSLN
ncbi:MAG: prepilin-type N-terminal cleavage/methylation domain-containing protein [Candidatus Margulisiibacteriota bacterium]